MPKKKKASKKAKRTCSKKHPCRECREESEEFAMLAQMGSLPVDMIMPLDQALAQLRNRR